MTHPVKNAEYGSYLWLLREVGYAIGVGRDDSTWDFQTRGRVESIVRSGEMQFAYPPPMQEVPVSSDATSQEGQEEVKDARTRQPYSWSFLRQLQTIEVKSGNHTYELPADFAGPSGDVVVGEGGGRLPIISEEHLRALQSQR